MYIYVWHTTKEKYGMVNFPIYHSWLRHSVGKNPYHISFVVVWDKLNSFHTLISDSSASFRFRVDKTWKGWICFFSRSQATASESRTQDLTASNLQLWNRFMISGYFVVLSSWFLEKILISPFSNKWICARSPSYFHSQVNLAFSKRVRTSWTPLSQD